MQNNLVEGDVYPVLYVEGNAELNLENVTVMENDNITHRLYVNNGKVTMSNCDFRDCRVVLSKAELNGDNINSIIRISIFHYLYSYVHPFYDGNGRINRLISSYYISKKCSLYIWIQFTVY